MTKGTLLIINEDKKDTDSLKKILLPESERIITLNRPDRINEILSSGTIDIIILGMDFKAGTRSGNEGFFWLREILNHDNNLSVIMLSDDNDAEKAVKAMREGASDYIIKPWNESRLITSVSAAFNLRQSKLEISDLRKDNQMLKEEINNSAERIVIGASPTMINVMNIVRKVAATNANVLITGENGTGKELVAREIHNLSDRSAELIVSVDMGSITESLFESELFGHVKGAFTDAMEDRKGKFEAANKSTLFLDEIGNLSLQSQSKLLRVLQTRQIIKVGSNKPIDIDIRLICATNQNLTQKISEGSFREDLFYRINTIMIEVPPLRDRVDDIPILASHFLRLYSERYSRAGLKFSTHALEKLSNHSWPGNVRELQHSIEKAVIMCDHPVLKPSDFIFNQSGKSFTNNEMTLDEMEKTLIQETLTRYSNNLSKTASRLGITRQTLYNKMKRYHL
jgi:two-component system, NtrC family, response regulator HydG